MKKRSILLSSAAVAIGGVSLLTPYNLGNTNHVAEVKALDSNSLLDGNLGLTQQDKHEDVILPEGNALGSAFNLLSFHYKRNRMEVRAFMPGDDYGWRVKRVVIAYRDYEGGVTEAEADENLKSLGINETGWKMMWDQDGKGIQSLYQLVTPKRNGKIVKLSENLTNMLYYAVQFGKTSEVDGALEWSDLWWMRGKISYRDCVHSKVFDPETSWCMREDNGDYTVRLPDYTRVEMPEEEIISWDEEWNEIQRQRYNNTQKNITDLEYNLYNISYILGQGDKILDGLDVTLPKAENMTDKGELTQGSKNLRERIKALRAYYDGLSGNSAKLTEELERLNQEKTELSEQIETLQSSKTVVEEENRELRQKLEALSNQGEGEGGGGTIGNESGDKTDKVDKKDEVDQGDKDASESPTTSIDKSQELVAKTETVIVAAQSGTQSTGESTEAGAKEIATKNDKTSEKQVIDRQEKAEELTEVPNLGDLEEESRMTPWWIVILAIGVLGTIGVGLGHLLKSKRK